MTLSFGRLFGVAVLAGCALLAFAGSLRSQASSPEVGSYGVVDRRLCRVVRQKSPSGSLYIRFADDVAEEEREVPFGRWSPFAGHAEALKVLKRDFSSKQEALVELAATVRGMEGNLQQGYDDTWLELMCVCLGGRDAPQDCVESERLPYLRRLLADCRSFDDRVIVSQIKWTDFVRQFCEELQSRIGKQKRGAERELQWQLMQEEVDQDLVALQRRLVAQRDGSLGEIDELLGETERMASTRENLGSKYFEVYDACTTLVSVCSRILDLVKAEEDAGAELAAVQGLAADGLGRAWVREASRRAEASFEAAYAELTSRRAAAAAPGEEDGPMGSAASGADEESRDRDSGRASSRSKSAGGGGLLVGGLIIAVIVLLLFISFVSSRTST